MNSFRRIVSLTAIATFTVLATAQQDRDAALKAIVNAERAFAALSVKTNIRDSFLANFADDGVVFNPNPVNAKELYSKRPAPPNPPPLTLFWEPIFADVSQAGDLGYTTGPYTLTDNAKKAIAAQGYFFSVWKKQANGNWKVALDFGIEGPVDRNIRSRSVKSAAQSNYRSGGKSNTEAERLGVMRAEKEFSTISETISNADAYSRFLYPEARMNRNGTQPYVGSAAINSHLSLQKTKTKWEPIRADVSSSADLGYTYGSYTSRQSGVQASEEKGNYARVWKREANGNWKIAMDTARPTDDKK